MAFTADKMNNQVVYKFSLKNLVLPKYSVARNVLFY